MFTAAGSSTGAELIRTVYIPGFVDAVNINNELLPLFGTPQQSPGDNAYRWKIHRGTNGSVATFLEGDGMPAAGSQAWASAAVTYLHFWGTIQVTGHARAAMRANYGIGVDTEAIGLRQDMTDLITRTFLGSTNGIEVAIDSTTTYAGITRTAGAYFSSYEQSVSDALSYSAMVTQFTTQSAFDYNSRPDLIIMPWNQIKRYHAISGQPGMKMFGTSDVGAQLTDLTFAGKPIAAINDMTTTIACWLDRRPDKWVNIYHDTDTSTQGWDVLDMGKSGDSDVYAIIYRGHLICKDPLRQGKMTGLTA